MATRALDIYQEYALAATPSSSSRRLTKTDKQLLPQVERRAKEQQIRKRLADQASTHLAELHQYQRELMTGLAYDAQDTIESFPEGIMARHLDAYVVGSWQRTARHMDGIKDDYANTARDGIRRQFACDDRSPWQKLLGR